MRTQADLDIRARFDREMEKQGVTYRTLAERMGITPASAYQVINADRGLIPQSLQDVAKELGLKIVARDIAD